MASFNRVILIGNLTRDPEVRYLPSGMTVVDLRLAVTRRYKTQSGEVKEDPCFVDVSVFGRQAENCNQYLAKGSPILVEGRLQYREWEKDGQKRSRLSVVAERIQFLGSGRRSAAAESPDNVEGDGAGVPEPLSRPEPEGPPPVEGGGDEDNLPF